VGWWHFYWHSSGAAENASVNRVSIQSVRRETVWDQLRVCGSKQTKYSYKKRWNTAKTTSDTEHSSAPTKHTGMYLLATSNFVISCHVTFNDQAVDIPVRLLSWVLPIQVIRPFEWVRIYNGPWMQQHYAKRRRKSRRAQSNWGSFVLYWLHTNPLLQIK
jgi:hypothetical protein